MKHIEYKPEECGECHQTTTYLLGIDRGTTEIMKEISRFIGRKGINVVHPRNEMEGVYLSSNQVGNLSRARMHGLLAAIEGNPGNYCITRKGGAFLKGIEVHKYVIRSKVEDRSIGYFGDEMVTIHDFSNADERWEGCGYSIEAGRIVYDLEESMNGSLFTPV